LPCALNSPRPPRGRSRVKCRAVFVAAVVDLGTLGTFATIKSGRKDSRLFHRRHEAEPETVDVRELLPLSWLGIPFRRFGFCARPSKSRAAEPVGNLCP